MGPGGPQSAALVISECQTGILDPAGSVTPALAAQAAERGLVARIAALAATAHEFMMGGLLPLVARITDAAAVLASLAELAGQA
jgi:hypothetical protein